MVEPQDPLCFLVRQRAEGQKVKGEQGDGGGERGAGDRALVQLHF
jgi:hypothetical protein